MNEDPYLLVQPCDCGKRNCGSVLIAMVRPAIREIDGTTTLASTVNLPIEHIQGMVDKLRELAADKGVIVR